MKDIEDLDVDATVESVCFRLHRYSKKMKHITTIITWEDDSCGVYGDTKSAELYCADEKILSIHNGGLFNVL